MSETLTIPAVDGTVLHARRWRGAESRGCLIVAHGLGEHSGCYDHVARTLAARPELVEVVAADFRGHGSSPGRRGVVREYEDLVADLEAVVGWAEVEFPDRPRFVLGHSNGGLVALHLAVKWPDRLAGLILSNPMLAVAAEVPGWKVAVGRLLHRVAPSVTLSAAIEPEAMNRDESSWPARLSDPLRHDRVNAAFYFGMVAGGARIAAEAESIRTPTLVLLGMADRVVDPRATVEFFERLGARDKALETYPEMRHEPLNEVGRERVIERLAEWLRARLPARPAGRSDSRPPE